MNRNGFSVALIAIALFVAGVAEGHWSDEGDSPRSVTAKRTFAYEGIPIAIDVPLHDELRIHLNESVEIGVPAALANKIEVTSVQGVVYFKASQSFISQRLALKGNRSGRFVLLDVSASPDGVSVPDIFIVTDGSSVKSEGSHSLSATQLMRYVASWTLAPRQPKSLPPELKRTVLAIPTDSIYRDFEVGSKPLAAWRTDQKIAVAVELLNQGDKPITLEPSQVAGVWHAVGFQHTRLLPSGKLGANTVMFLVGGHDAITELRL